MKYNLKTRRLKFEAADVMTYKKRSYTKEVKGINPNLNVLRPTINEKSNVFLERTLCQFKMGFHKNTCKVKMRRLISIAEALICARKIATYTVATIVMTIVIWGSVSAIDLRLASEAIVDGHPIGVVENTKNFEKLMADVQSSIGQTLGEPVLTVKKPVYITRLVFKKDLTSEYNLKQNLLSTYDKVIGAYAVYYGDKLICASLDEASVNSALEKIKSKYVISGTEATVDFAEPMVVKKEFVPVGYVRSAEGVYEALTAPKEQPQQYTVKENDTLWSISSVYNMTIDQLVEINENINDMIHIGDVINITKSVPAVSVKVSYVQTSEQDIPFENEKITDNNLNAGKVEVVKEGTLGKKVVTESIVKIDNDIVERNVQQENIISQPISGTIKIGARKVTGVGTGQYIRPAYGTLTSRFGRRGRGQHTGIDLANPVGTPIVAADSGTVTFAGYSGGYGYLVKLSHGNGMETYYAHCSKLLVSNGQKVVKGEQIAKVGNTGNSTGPHLHFEVRKDGIPQNPASYLK